MIPPQNRNEQKILSQQKTVFLVTALIVMSGMFFIRGGEVSRDTLILIACLPQIYLGISAIKNKVSIVRFKGQKEPARGEQATMVGFFILTIVGLQIFFILIPQALSSFFPINNLFQAARRNDNVMTNSEYLYQISATSHFTEVNLLQNVDITGRNKSVPIALTNDSLFLIGSMQGVEYYVSLVSANPMTGEINWQTQAKAHFLAVFDTHVYVESRSQPSSKVTSVVAYEKNSGDKVWQTDFEQYEALGVSYLAVTESSLSVETYYQARVTFYALDLESGKLQSTIRDKDSVFMVDNEHIYEWLGDSLVAKGKYGWQTQLGRELYIYDTDIAEPVVADGLILVRKGHYSNSQPIFAVSKADGSIIWQLNQVVVSNLAVTGKHTFFITKQAQLMAVDTVTGQILASVNFVPSFGEEFDFVNSSIYVAAHNDLVAVYFSDTRQLSVLRFSPPTP